MYQNKLDDKPLTPAHLLLLPIENTKFINFLNFSSIGSNTLKGSEAFVKVRNTSKIYNSNLVYSSSDFTNKYLKLNQLYTTDNSFLNTLTYGLRRQHNLISSSATLNTVSPFLDFQSASKFLNYNLAYKNSL